MTEADDTTDVERHDALFEEALDLVTGLWSGQLLYAAVELGIFDCLADDPKTANTVAGEHGLDADATYRLLRALGYYDVVAENPRRQFSLTPVGECFLTDHPRSVSADLLFARSPEFVSAMQHLPDIVREGGPNGFAREFGCGLYEYAEEHHGFGQAFNRFMTAKSRRHADQVLDALDAANITACSHVCDVGGGHGYLLARVLEAHPHLQGTVLDLPGVVSQSERREAPNIGVSDRCDYVAGDMFEAVPTADGYLLKTILHNWDDEACMEVLATIHDSAPDDGRLFVIEKVVPGPGTDHFVKRLDMTMLVHLGGRERTEAEYVALFEQAGWTHVETYGSPEEPSNVLEAAKA